MKFLVIATVLSLATANTWAQGKVTRLKCPIFKGSPSWEIVLDEANGTVSEIRGGGNSDTYKAAFGSDAVMWTGRTKGYTFKNNISRIDLKFIRHTYSEASRSTYTDEAVCEIQKPPTTTKF
ncbi:hypothetical protein SB816_28530 [Achromobacter sp. SIMBA_011]|uniref:hypothetical protein n=1 Tax=Achromobacter TaxID=222 RepID=UPI0011A115BB|nr:hypothetical protein [Achromobacter dolens]MCZ8407557.1 hypothetical protein [Achromobacter dolens]CAB3864031.1 hypothetical protein LMG26842_03506 [Achromobacter dolens]